MAQLAKEYTRVAVLALECHRHLRTGLSLNVSLAVIGCHDANLATKNS